MAGVKGKSGGPRQNAGGARVGAGRKPKATAAPAKKSANASAAHVELEGQAHGGALKRTRAKTVPMADRDMLQLLQDVALGKVEASTVQVRAAIAAVQYTHTKKGDGGKKDEAAGKAAKAASKYAPTAAPPLKLVKKA